MNLVAFSIRTKGTHNFIRRLCTVFTRFGFTEARIRRALNTIIDTTRHFNGSPTFFIPAVVLARHPALIEKIVQGGTEIGVHGYVHNDYRTLSKEQQLQQTQKAISIFKRVEIPYFGFRNPYLGWTKESLEVFADLGFRYESNIAILHDVVDQEAFTPLVRSGFAKSLDLFQAVPCNAYALRPHFEGELLRIPTSIPDDEMLFDRLRITDAQDVGNIWSEVMQRVYNLGGLYALNLHPERGILCQQALETLLVYAHSRQLPVWVTRIGDVAQWWKERSPYRFDMNPLGDQCWRVEAHSSPRATILARNLAVEESPTIPWFDMDMHVQSEAFTVKASVCPCIALSQRTSEQVEAFLYEQGYPVIRCLEGEAHLYAMYLDRPEGLGATSEEHTASKIALVEQLETLELPLVHFGCWPDGNRAALCISGDIDSITVQDFFLRIVEVFRQK